MIDGTRGYEGRGALGQAGGRGISWIGALALLAGVLGVLMLPAAAAATAPQIFAKQGRGAGQVEDPVGVAVDQSSGDVYIADHNNFRIDKFGPFSGFLLAWGYGVADGATLALQSCGPEATPPTTRCFEGPTAAEGPGAVHPVDIAVDRSTGDVYVSDRDYVSDTEDEGYRVEKFSSTGQFLLMFGGGVDSTPGTTHPNLCTAADLAAGDTCGAGTPGTGAGQFSSEEYLPVAVDASGDVWVGDEDRLEEFNSSGEYVSKVSLAGEEEEEEETMALAVDSSGDFYVVGANPNLHGVRKLKSTGHLIETLDAAGNPKALGLDPATGDLFVSDQFGEVVAEEGKATLLEYGPSGAQIEQFGAGQILGNPTGNALAVGDGAESLYVAGSTVDSNVQRFSLPEPGPLPENEHAAAVTPSAATLAGTLNPEGHASSYHFEYGTSESYGQVTATTTLPGSGFTGEAVQAGIADLIPATEYHFRLVATNHCNTAVPGEECTVRGEDVSFTTPSAVQIEGQSATAVTAESAAFDAELNALGAPATWWVEYGPSESYGFSTAEQSLPSGSSLVAVGAFVRELAPASVYHYRFVARDERDGVLYTTYGEDRTITTQLAGLASLLPDGRAWELVSPVEKVGGEVRVGGNGVMQAAQNGDALVYVTRGPLEAGPQGQRAPEGTQVLARHGVGGWGSSDITTPYSTATPALIGLSEYAFFSADLSAAVVEPRDSEPLSVEASERTPYLRDNAAEPASYRPLVTGKEGYANVPLGTEFGGGSPLETNRSDVRFEGATSDLSHLVLSGPPLVAGAPSLGLYEWTGGGLSLVSVLPAGEGGTAVKGELGAGSRSVRHAISSDGSRVFWTSGEGLYMRDVASVEPESVRLDVVQPGASGTGAAAPVFQGANAEGTMAFFTDTQQLTADAGEAGADLYECEIGESAGKPTCVLRDLTPESSLGESAGVQGLLAGLSEDGTYVYFVANGVLAPGATPGDCTSTTAPSATCNLYLLHYSGEAQDWETRFVAGLSNEDAGDWGTSIGEVRQAGAVGLTAASSPDGGYLAFMSQRSLTGYDNVDASGGERDEEVYLYDAAAAALRCVSCDPTGARPAGRLDEGTEGHPVAFDRQSLWNGRWLAATVPDPEKPEVDGVSWYQPRFVLDSGRVFFDSPDALVSADANGAWDAYEYEPTGVGSCEASSGGGAVSRTTGGCVALLSAGTSGEESTFLDASASGDDVFIVTAARLSTQDVDTVDDVYDVHVCGSGWQCPVVVAAPPACMTADACRAAPSPQPEIFGAPPSQTFSGAGNLAPSAPEPAVKAKAKPLTRAQKLAQALKACAKKPKRKRTACRTQAKRKYGNKTKAKKAGKAESSRMSDTHAKRGRQ